MNHPEILACAFEQASDGMLLIENGCFIDCNQAAVSMLGCASKADIIGKHPADLSPLTQPNGQDSAERAEAMMALAKSKENARFEWTHVRADGQPLYVEVLLTHVDHDDRTFFHVNWRDISYRRETEYALRYRQSLEALITRTSGKFINLSAKEIDNGIHQALGDLGAFVQADRSYVFAYHDEQMSNTHEWCAAGIAPQIERMQRIPIDAMQWSNEQIMRGEILNIASLDDLPAMAQSEKNEFTKQGIQSLLVVPMERRGQVVGFIGFDAVREKRDWQAEIIDLLRLAAGIIANVLDRRKAELQLRETNRTLERNIQARTQQLEQRRRIAESLRETLAAVNSSQSLDEILQHITHQAKTLTKAGACTLYSMNHEHGTGKMEAASGALMDMPESDRYFELTSTPGLELLNIVACRKPQSVKFEKKHLPKLESDTNVPPHIRDRRVEIFKRFDGSIAAPIYVRDVAYGAILLYYQGEQSFTDQQLQIAQTLAEQAALAIENARLHQAAHVRQVEAEQRRRIAEGLREGLAVLNSNRSLDDILGFVVQQAVNLLETDGGALYILDSAGEMLSIGASFGLDPDYTTLKIPIGGAITGRAVKLGEPVSIPNMAQAQELLETYLNEPNMPPGWIEGLRKLRERYNAVLAVPVQTQTQTYGAVTLYYADHQQFTDEVIALALAFASQVALVIENARLRERVRESAAVEERNRLARDLHDAVTQTLFSASLIADTLPNLWEVDEVDARQQIMRIGQLTRGALAEMRTLLIELRPARLVEADMKSLIEQLVDAARGRSKIEIMLNHYGTCQLPPDVKIVFYRIIQEGLQNINRHAQADHAFVSLRCDTQQVTLQILDDGRGFDANAIPAGHFGVQIMRERVSSIGGTFILDTHPNEGTKIQVTWRKP